MRSRRDLVLARAVWAFAVWAAAGCGDGGEPGAPASGAPGPGAGAPAVTDDAGREVVLPRPAGRVISLVPSVTETVVALGAADRLVARTRYDRDPALAELPSLGGGLDPSLERLIALRPDLVVAWSARDDRTLRPRLSSAGVPVYSAAVEDTAGVFATIERFGRLLGRVRSADSLARAIRDSLAVVAAESSGGGVRPTALYLIDGDPPRAAGAASFIGELIEVAGGRAAFPELNEPWPAVSLEAILDRDPDIVILPIGPGLPGTAELAGRPGYRELGAFRAGRVVEVPADLLARPGPGVARAARALRSGIERHEAEP